MIYYDWKYNTKSLEGFKKLYEIAKKEWSVEAIKDMENYGENGEMWFESKKELDDFLKKTNEKK